MTKIRQAAGRARKVAVTGGVSMGLLLGGLEGIGHADRVDDAQRRLGEMDEKARVLMSEFRDTDTPDPHAGERRVLEAETLFQLKNYDEAAIIALDVVEKYPNTRVYDDAIYLVGESLFRKGDFLSARRYFDLAGKRGTGAKKEQQALQRLVEIALKVDDYSNIEDVFDRLAKIPPAQLEPSVPYVRGKYLFFRGKLDEAFLAFAQVAPTNPYYMQSRYLVATTQVKKGDLAQAVAAFNEVLRLQPRTDDEKEIQDLARLAIGRINYHEGRSDQARDAFASVNRESKYFSDAMNEQAWNAIRAGDFRAAYRAFDLMVLQNPDAPRAPELNIYMGNLHVRMANFAMASDKFGQILAEYEPIYKELKLTNEKAAADPKFFDGLLAKGIDKFDISSLFPKGAIRLVSEDLDMAKLLALAGDVGDLSRDIKELEQLLGRLERAVNGNARVGAFPDLAASRGKSTEVINSVVAMRARFSSDARNLVGQYLSPTDQGALEQTAAERKFLDEMVDKLPTTTDGLRDRNLALRGQFFDLDGVASEMNVMIQALEAELVAMEQYFVLSKAETKIRPDDLKRPIEDLRNEVAGLRTQLEKVRNDIIEGGQEASMSGAAGQPDRLVTNRLTDLLRREQDVFARARSGMPSGAQQELDRYSDIIARCDAIQQQLLPFDQRLEAVADRRLVKVREQLATEKGQLVVENTKLGAIFGESRGVGGGLVQALLGKVTNRFYDLTVQSDVGLIDVAWGLKDDKSNTLSNLVTQQKSEVKALQDDFNQLLSGEKIGDSTEGKPGEEIQ